MEREAAEKTIVRDALHDLQRKIVADQVPNWREIEFYTSLHISQFPM